MKKFINIMLVTGCLLLISGCTKEAEVQEESAIPEIHRNAEVQGDSFTQEIESEAEAQNDSLIPEMKSEAESVCADWDQVVNENLQTIQEIALSQSTIDFMKAQNDDALKSTELDYLNSFGDSGTIALTDASGMQLLKTEGDLLDVSDREYYHQAIEGKTYTSDIVISKSQGNCKVIFSAPIKDGDNIIGIVQKDYDLFEFHKILADKYEYAFIVDTAGYMAAHSQFDVTPDTVEDRSSSEFMTSGNPEGNYDVDTGNGMKIVYYVTSSVSGWKVCVVRDVETEETTDN